MIRPAPIVAVTEAGVTHRKVHYVDRGWLPTVTVWRERRITWNSWTRIWT